MTLRPVPAAPALVALTLLASGACGTTQKQAVRPKNIDLVKPAERAGDADPPVDTSRAPSAEAYRLLLEAELRLTDSDYLGAAEALSEAVVHDPRSAFLKVRHGEVRLRMGDADRALSEARRALTLSPDLVAAWHLLGAAEQQAANSEGAERAYREAMKREPGNGDAAAALAELLVERGDLDDAAAVVDTWMEHDPGATEGYRTLAELYAERGDLDRARHYVDLALSRDALNADALDLAVRVHQSTGAYAIALRHVRSLVKERGDGPATRYLLLVALRLAGERAEAEALAQSWVDDDPSTDMALLLAEAEENTGDVRGAIERLARHPDAKRSMPIAARRGRLLFGEGRYKETASAVCPFTDSGTDWGPYLESLCIRGLLYGGAPGDAMARYMTARERFPRAERILDIGLELEAATGSDLGVLEAVMQRRDDEPKDKGLLDVHARALEASGDNAAARRILEAARAERMHDGELTMSLARHLERTGEGEAAARLGVQLIERQARPTTSQLNFTAFTIADHGLRLGSPVVWARAAVLRDPLSGYVVDTLGWVLFRSGQVDAAALTLQRALQLAPSEPEVMLHLALVQQSRGQHAQATVLLQRAKLRAAAYPELAAKLDAAAEVIWDR